MGDLEILFIIIIIFIISFFQLHDAAGRTRPGPTQSTEAAALV